MTIFKEQMPPVAKMAIGDCRIFVQTRSLNRLKV